MKWLDLREQDGAQLLLGPVELHLKELSSDPLTSPTIVAYLSSQMDSLTSLLQNMRNLEEELRDVNVLATKKRDMLPKFAHALLRLQRIMIDLLECPAGRTLDCLLALAAHTYSIFSEAFTEENSFNLFVELATNELNLMRGLKSSTAIFNPTLVSLGLKLATSDLPEAQKIAKRITKFLWRKTAQPQIVCAELIAHYPSIASVHKRPRLEYLQLAR